MCRHLISPQNRISALLVSYWLAVYKIRKDFVSFFLLCSISSFVFRSICNLTSTHEHASKLLLSFLKADLGYPIQVNAISTQGASDTMDWVESYLVSFSVDGIKWRLYFEHTAPRVCSPQVSFLSSMLDFFL